MSKNAITAQSGPVVVTGSGGFIGSHIVLNLVKRGYQVRACVRDASNEVNNAHLKSMNQIGPGSVELYSCDMMLAGAYDTVFKGAVAVFHAAAEMGNLEGSTPMKVYEGGVEATRLVIDSIKRSESVRRLIYTSSFAAVGHPCEEGYRYTEDSWADMNQELRREGSQWSMEIVSKNREVAYAMTKVESERLVYSEADANGFEAFGVCPCHVIGPVLSAGHQRPWAWQTRIGDMLEGVGHRRMFWNIVDVRDVAEAQVLIAENTENHSGQRYNLVATDESGLINQDRLQAILQNLYPDLAIGGNVKEGSTFRSPVAVLEKCVSQLGLTPHSVEDAVRDNAESLLMWGLVSPRHGRDNWQRDDNDLGLTSKWNPHVYPAIDPELRKKLETEGKI
ncbi:NAD-dependent epimerase/dehydratase family protein [Gammaproteobacteria bacterium]|nr:NAD-dependent epimerase/dehydratase family protein [Gammaproteobacteria bacterium]